MRVLRYLLCLLLALGRPAYGQSVTPTFPVGGTQISAIASGSAVTLTTATTANITTVTLTPGTWVCSGGVNFVAGTVAPSLLNGGLTPTSATGPGYDGNFSISQPTTAFSVANQNHGLGMIVITTAANLQIWLYATATFASGTAWKAYGTVNCVRVK